MEKKVFSADVREDQEGVKVAVFEHTLVKESDSFFYFRKSDGRIEKEGKRRPMVANWKGNLYDSRSDALAAIQGQLESRLESILDSIPKYRAAIKANEEAVVKACQEEVL